MMMIIIIIIVIIIVTITLTKDYHLQISWQLERKAYNIYI